ncbi:MAG: NUDIX domain-containing protein [Clostridia bacterium]
MEEFFDVLSDKGEYIDRVETREICHKDGLWHKAVAGFIINDKKQVLLQKRSEKKKMWPNMWDITFGGHVLAGEFGFEAITRECKEELGLDIDKKDLVFIGSSISTNIKGDIINRHFNEYYIANKNIDEKLLKLQPDEVSEVKWIDKEEIIKRIEKNYDGITDKEGCWKYLIKYYEWLDNK